MGQYAVLAVLGAFILGGAVLFNAQRSAQGADDELTGYHGDRFSREAALVGLKRMERRLAANLDEWNDTESTNAATRNAAFARFNSSNTAYGPGSFTVAFNDYQAGTGSGVTATSDLAFVTAVGRYDGERFTVRAVYEKGITDVGTPPQMRSAIVANQRLYLNGNVEIAGGVHTNDELDSNGNSFAVTGTGTYVDAPGTVVNSTRFSGGTVHGDSVYVPPVVIPTTGITHSTPTNTSVAINGTQSVALTTQAITAVLTTGSGNGNGNGGGGGTTSALTVNGAGTAANPYVLVIRGNATFSGNVRLVGHIKIFVQGNVTVAGNTVIAPVANPLAVPNQFSSVAQTQAWAAANLPSGNTIGIYATGGISMSGNATIAAHLYANGAVSYAGGGHRIVLGGITTGSPLEVRGNAQIVYTDAATSIYYPGNNRRVPEGVRLVSYREHSTR